MDGKTRDRRRECRTGNGDLGTTTQQVFAGEQWDYVFLAKSHRGIPDVEILDKLLPPDTVLLTGDCVLHTRALERGYRSYTVNDHGQLTRRRLPHVRKRKPLPKGVHSALQADYRQHPAHNLAQRLKTDLTERQFKRYRTARRRIRSHFGSAAAICQVSVTVDSMTTPCGQLCGFAFHVAGNSGVKGLRASEGYGRSKEHAPDAAWPLLHALRDQYLLQLDRVRTDLYIVPQASLELAHELIENLHPVSEPGHEAVRQLIQALPKSTLHACEKGPFHDAMQAKLEQLNRSGSNEVVSLDYRKVAAQVLAAKFNESQSELT